MTVIAHLSDPHFGTERANVVDALVRLLHTRIPELLILSGDITQRARKSQFRAARLFLDRVAATNSLVIPGNHDIPLFNLYYRLFKPYSNYEAFFGTDKEPVHRSETALVIGVNTTRYYRHVDGEISKRQIDRVCDHLQRGLPDQLKLVVTHQPVYVPYASETKNLLHGHEAATKAWSEAGADCILGGHIHLPYVAAMHELDALINQPFWVIQAGTAVSTRVRAGINNSVNVVDYAPKLAECVVERWDYSPADDAFTLANQHKLKFNRCST